MTMNGGDGTEYKLASIPEEYANVVTASLHVSANVSNPDAGLSASINTLGEINIRMLGSTNPYYFYIGGTWYID